MAGCKRGKTASSVPPSPPLTRAVAAAVWPAASIVRMMYHMALRRGRTGERGRENRCSIPTYTWKHLSKILRGSHRHDCANPNNFQLMSAWSYFDNFKFCANGSCKTSVRCIKECLKHGGKFRRRSVSSPNGSLVRLRLTTKLR